MKFKNILLIVLLGIMFVIPGVVAAEKDIVVENIKVINASDDVSLNSLKKVDVKFNDLDQVVEYEINLRNNTNDKLFLKQFNVSGSSDDFIQYTFNNEDFGKEIGNGETTKVNVLVKTLEIESAGRNTNDNIKLNFIFSKSFKNNRLKIILIIILISILFFIVFSKGYRKEKFSIFIICLICIGIINYFIDNSVVAEVDGNVLYDSQNVMENSGNLVAANTINYSNSKDVWSYYDRIKNIYIKSDNFVIEKYYKKFDLTIDNKNRVVGYLVENNDSDVFYDLYIISNGIIYANEDSTGLFSFPNVEKIEGLNNIRFDGTKIFKGMFMGDEELSKIDISSINFNNASDVSYMFYKTNVVNVSNLDLPKGVIKNNIVATYLYDLVKDGAVTDKNVLFSKIDNDGKYIVNSTIGDKYPIYYYRGDIKDNNAKFGGFCWQIVRTTNSGGVKLIYNGIPTGDGSCNNKNEASQIGNTTYNDLYNSPTHIGYMYGKTYTTSSTYLGKSTIVYGNDVEWDGKKYILKNTFTSNNFTNDYKVIGEKYHYTCFNSSLECTEIKYITFINSTSNPWYLIFKDGIKLEEAKDEMFTNTSDSNVKKLIDNWYKKNMISYTHLLEDTIWCNDRTFKNGAMLSKDLSSLIRSDFGSIIRLNSYIPSISCDNKNDSFTVNSSVGNGKLTYPVGLLTADEVILAGNRGADYNSSNSYLINSDTWTMSPMFFNYCDNNMLLNDGRLLDRNVNNVIGVRPAISLRYGIDYIDGDGSVNNPYIINEKEIIYRENK